jgi:hypothetical protein
MDTKSAYVGCWLVVLAAGCAGTARPARSADPGAPFAGEPETTAFPESAGAESAGAKSAEASAEADEGRASTPPPQAASRSAATSDTRSFEPSSKAEAEAAAAAPTERERPGLGTEWGETRASHVYDVTFLRASPGRPFAVAQLFYNDRAGVDALSAYHGGGTPRPLGVTAADGLITVYLVDKDWGTALEAMRVGSRTYVAGEEGHRYSILIANRTAHRYEAVATVDGLDVISGRAGSLENRGYLVSPWTTIEVDGFRQSEDAVAAFRFSKVGESYAAQRGRGRNVGVIGVAFFAEQGDEWSNDELRTRDTARPFPHDGRFAPPPW